MVVLIVEALRTDDSEESVGYRGLKDRIVMVVLVVEASRAEDSDGNVGNGSCNVVLR